MTSCTCHPFPDCALVVFVRGGGGGGGGGQGTSGRGRAAGNGYCPPRMVRSTRRPVPRDVIPTRYQSTRVQHGTAFCPCAKVRACALGPAEASHAANRVFHFRFHWYYRRDDRQQHPGAVRGCPVRQAPVAVHRRSEEHTSELQSLMRISY